MREWRGAFSAGTAGQIAQMHRKVYGACFRDLRREWHDFQRRLGCAVQGMTGGPCLQGTAGQHIQMYRAHLWGVRSRWEGVQRCGGWKIEAMTGAFVHRDRGGET